MATADELGAFLKRANGGPVVLDFSGVSFMDSSGLRAVLDVAGSIDGGVVLLHPSEQVRRVLDISIPTGAPGLEVRP
jgi:anti-anti-sigma factor